jgi:hypothetical protein
MQPIVLGDDSVCVDLNQLTAVRTRERWLARELRVVRNDLLDLLLGHLPGKEVHFRMFAST